MGKSYRNYSKTSKTPRRPYEKERLDSELILIGKFGLKNKRELWRVQLSLAKIRKAARELLTLEEKDPRRLFEGMHPLAITVIPQVVPCSEEWLDTVSWPTTKRSWIMSCD